MPAPSRLPELGPRGEGWVVLQLLLGTGVVAAGFVGVYWPRGVESFFALLGLLMAVGGLILLLLGILSLGRSFTPLPRPQARAKLRQHGIFRLVRHPIYGGLILVALGWSLTEAPLALIPTALLAALFELKARREEAWLTERYPEYAAYRTRTPRRFVPWLF